MKARTGRPTNVLRNRMAKIGNHITHRCGSSCVAPDGRLRNAGVLRNMPKWSVKHRRSEDALFGTSTDVAAMYADHEFAEELAHDFEYIGSDGLHSMVRGSETLLQVIMRTKIFLLSDGQSRGQMCQLAHPSDTRRQNRKTRETATEFSKRPIQPQL